MAFADFHLQQSEVTSLLGAIRAGSLRVEKIKIGRRAFWVKRSERHGFRMRLQKGNALNAFMREKTALISLQGVGAPVAELVAEGDDYFVMPDYGPDLQKVLRTETEASQRVELLTQAVSCMSNLHQMGFAHGRASLKDMCEHEGKIVFLDFERYREKNNTTRGMARDVFIFAVNAFAFVPLSRAELDRVLSHYRASAPECVWGELEAFARKMRWAEFFTRPLQKRREGKAKEFKALPVVIEAILQGR